MPLKLSLPTFFDLKHKVTVILVHPSNQYQKIIPNTIPYDILMGWYFIRVCFTYTTMRGYESFFSKSAMLVVQSLRAQKGIKNLSEKKYEKTYRIRYGSGYDSIFMRSDSVEGKQGRESNEYHLYLRENDPSFLQRNTTKCCILILLL